MVRGGEPIDRSFNPNCPACRKARIHNKEEWKKFHPHVGEGIDNRNKKSIKKDRR